MTDSELVEKTAREVMRESTIFYLPDCTLPFVYDDEGRARRWNPLTDANDSQMVKDKLREMGWKVRIIIWPRGNVLVNLEPFSNNGDFIEVAADTETRAICEAAIKAMEGWENG